ncbi:hypothetical protein HXX76_001665 [Chlamydomonas incerta]|uniref:J domain-containing protein n=1 Tax=Chlamydomonas incerta TaxID=51695 RepID=A0A835WCI8_CHLIN|nr:hypothetical protein HXX76_001665 [Chlamydomonas incerta]|eukprot:KAG2444929.1 hypothetical protein HXX76_001665 [Chlamydomonas incerta]
MGSKKEKKEKDKKGKKDKKEKKDKHKKEKHRRRSSSSGSDSDDSVEGAEQQLRRERAAVIKLRDILSEYPAVRKELREMLWRVDQGEATNISGVPDPVLKGHLAQLLELLRLRRNDKGIFGLINRNERILPVVGFVFDEPPRPRPAPAPAPPPPAPAPEAARDTGPAVDQARQQHQQHQQPKHEEGSQRPRAAVGPSMGPAGPVKREPAAHDDEDGRVEAVGSDDEDDEEGRRAGPSVRVAGPAMPPPGRLKSEDGEEAAAAAEAAATAVKEEEPAAEGEGEPPGPAPGPAKRRVAGPAMPPRELLEAAAAAAQALAAGGVDGDEDDDYDLVGPPPPEMVEELDAAPQNDREAEVVRIIKVLREHAASVKAPPGGSLLAAAADPTHIDAYAVLDVAAAAAPGEVKKRYMRLSLLIHPDKCAHAMAHEAFQAVATAAKVLQDSALRGALDERRADLELRKRAEAAAAVQERERQWRVARGEEVLVAGPSGPMGFERETWMTDLPPELSARIGGGQVSQTSVRAFNQRGKTGRGDTSGWTDTPEQRKAKEAQALLAAASDAYVRALPAAGVDAGAITGPSAGPVAGRSAAAAAAVDAFNIGNRQKSLMEVHKEMQEKAKAEAKAARKAAKAAKKQKLADGSAAGKGEGEDEEGDWPWRQFDRERDLDLKPRAKSGNEILKSAAALGSKFSGGNVQRHFL